MKLLPGGFAQLLLIVQWFVDLHLEHIEEAALGTLAPETDAPSEEEALECLLWIFEERQEESDRETLEAYMGARAGEWWTDYPECQLLTTLVQRADRRKKWLGTKDDKRRPWHEEGLRIAKPLLAGIPDKINLDPEVEYEAMANVLAALLSPPMGESSPETLQRYIELAKSTPSTATPSSATLRSLMTPSRPSHVRRSGGIRGLLAGVGCGITPRQKSSPTPPRQTGPPSAQSPHPVCHRAPG